jgi:TRAP-type C4-dicarboxylate transport system substrate-binding protein
MGGRMKKLVVLLSVMALATFSSQVSWSKEVFKLGTLAPEGSNFMKAFNNLNQEIIEKTGGEVEFRVYTGGVMGNDADLLRKMRVGQIQGGALTAGGASAVYPDLGAMSVPLIFRNYDEVDYVLSRMTPKFDSELEKKGYMALGWTEAGFAYIMSQAPIRSVQDLKGKKVWIPQGDPADQTVFEKAGVPPIPLSLPDVITSLQTHQLNTVCTSPVGAVILQWYTKVKYITNEPLLFVYGVVMVSKKSFEKISPQNQKIIKELFAKYFKELTVQTRKDNDAALDAMTKRGIELVSVTPENHAGLVRLIDEAKVELYKKGIFTKETVDMIEKSVQEYRQTHPD